MYDVVLRGGKDLGYPPLPRKYRDSQHLCLPPPVYMNAAQTDTCGYTRGGSYSSVRR